MEVAGSGERRELGPEFLVRTSVMTGKREDERSKTRDQLGAQPSSGATFRSTELTLVTRIVKYPPRGKTHDDRLDMDRVDVHELVRTIECSPCGR